MTEFTLSDCQGTYDRPFMEEFYDLIHRVLLSLVLHSNDNAVDYRSETRDASRQALAKTLDIFSVTNTTTDPNVDKVR